MPITCKGERSAAFFLLEQNRDNPVLEIYVVLTSRQWRDYMQNTAGEKAAACNRIIAAADRCEVCPAAICRREPKRSCGSDSSGNWWPSSPPNGKRENC